MSDPLEFIPGYISPLTDREHARIGRIALLWGQIEHLVEQLILHVSGLTLAELTALEITDKPIAAKTAYLNRIRGRHDDAGVREALGAFCAAIQDTKMARNHVFHGIWGWRGDKRTHKVVPAARKTQIPGQPFRATQLPPLEKKLCRCARTGFDLITRLSGESVWYKYTRFLHHSDETVSPQWFLQWTKRNPLDDALLDRTSPKGQLPRLKTLYPPK